MNESSSRGASDVTFSVGVTCCQTYCMVIRFCVRPFKYTRVSHYEHDKGFLSGSSAFRLVLIWDPVYIDD